MGLGLTFAASYLVILGVLRATFYFKKYWGWYSNPSSYDHAPHPYMAKNSQCFVHLMDIFLTFYCFGCIPVCLTVGLDVSIRKKIQKKARLTMLLSIKLPELTNH